MKQGHKSLKREGEKKLKTKKKEYYFSFIQIYNHFIIEVILQQLF